MMPLDAGFDYQTAEAVEIVFPDDAMGGEVAYRRWNGEGTWAHESQSYAEGGIMDIGEISVGATVSEATSVTLDIASQADRDLFLSHDPGPARCRVFELWRKRPRGGAWPAWNVREAYKGKLSTPSYANGSISIDVQRAYDDVWRGVLLRWTGTDQRRRYPDDSGLDRADRIRRSGLVVATT